MDVISWFIFGFTIVERLVELVVSRRNEAWSLARGGIEFGREHYKWMVFMHTAFFLCILMEFTHWGSDVPMGVRAASVLIALLCQVARWWIIKTLGPQWNTRVIIVPGMGRVTTGPYRFLKHPNYVVVAVETIMLPLVFGAWRTAIVFSMLNALMMKVRVSVENSALKNLKAT